MTSRNSSTSWPTRNRGQPDREHSTAYFASEEEDVILTLDPAGVLAVAVDPLDGSSNIDINASVGTIFSVFPASGDGATASFFRPGAEQLAAGYFVYGPHTDLVLTTGDGVHLFVLDRAPRLPARPLRVAIPRSAREFAINTSNYRHWFEPVRAFVDECLAGAEGPRGGPISTCDGWRRHGRGRPPHLHPRRHLSLSGRPPPRLRSGRLRLIYEAFPIAWLAEQAGGGATDGRAAILDKIPGELHERTPLIFGSASEVAIVTGHHDAPSDRPKQAPLFGRRGLFRS